MNIFNDIKKRSSQGFLAEFTPSWIHYTSVCFYIFYKGIFEGTPLWFTGTNTILPLGGATYNSKKDVLKNFPKKYLPNTISVSYEETLGTIGSELLEKKMLEGGLSYPVVIKPNFGKRGLGVEVLHSYEDMKEKIDTRNYFSDTSERKDRILQEFITEPLEVGIFYTRNPNKENGTITGIVQKEFLSVVGNGASSLESLIINHPRAKYHKNYLKKQFTKNRNDVIEDGKTINIVEIGTHSMGSTFIDASHMITPTLTKTIDELSKNLNGFYYGRYDIKANSWESLSSGDYKVIELNMTYAEPTWMYDPSYSFWKAQSILLNHWQKMYIIAKSNNDKGFTYTTIKQRRKAKKYFTI